MNLKNILLIVAIVTVSVASAAAQNANGGVWTIDFIKTKAGQRDNYLKYIRENWAEYRRMLRDTGKIASYQVFSLPPGETTAQWDILLVTEYPNKEIYDQREALFTEVFKIRPVASVGGISNGREAADIVSTKNLVQPITSQTAQIMPKTETSKPEEAAARIPLENYLKGHATGDPAFIRQAFEPNAKITSFRDGKLSAMTVEEFAARFSGKPAADERERRRAIESIDISGSAGIAKITLDYPTVKFVDYMTLLKIGGEWKIVNKSFYAETKIPPK